MRSSKNYLQKEFRTRTEKSEAYLASTQPSDIENSQISRKLKLVLSNKSFHRQNSESSQLIQKQTINKNNNQLEIRGNTTYTEVSDTVNYQSSPVKILKSVKKPEIRTSQKDLEKIVQDQSELLSHYQKVLVEISTKIMKKTKSDETLTEISQLIERDVYGQTAQEFYHKWKAEKILSSQLDDQIQEYKRILRNTQEELILQIKQKQEVEQAYSQTIEEQNNQIAELKLQLKQYKQEFPPHLGSQIKMEKLEGENYELKKALQSQLKEVNYLYNKMQFNSAKIDMSNVLRC